MRNKPEVIIIEGIDLSGKSTLFEQMIKSFPGIGIKITDRPLDKTEKERKKIKDYYRSVLAFININYQNKTILLDRFFPSEIVYSQVKRGYEAMDDRDLRDFEKVIKYRKHLILYCDPGIETIIERLKNRGDDYIKEEDLKELHSRYNRYFEKTTLEFLRLDTKKPVKELIDEIRPVLEEISNGITKPKQLKLFE